MREKSLTLAQTRLFQSTKFALLNLLAYTLSADRASHSKQEGRSVAVPFSCSAVCPNWRKMYTFYDMYISIMALLD